MKDCLLSWEIHYEIALANEAQIQAATIFHAK
jgi:hypothetical protein